MSERWIEIGAPTTGRVRGASVQIGWRLLFSFEAWLDVGYEGSLFEATATVAVGPWRWAFNWCPARPAAEEAR